MRGRTPQTDTQAIVPASKTWNTPVYQGGHRLSQLRCAVHYLRLCRSYWATQSAYCTCVVDDEQRRMRQTISVYSPNQAYKNSVNLRNRCFGRALGVDCN